jgi:thioredoxin 1
LKNLQKSTGVKIAVLLLIAAAIGGIWFVKQQEKARQEASSALHVTSAEELTQARASGLPVVIDFGADSCAPCREMAPVLEELSRTLKGKAVIKFVDVWKYQNLAEGYPLRVIPTQFFFDRDGKPFTPSDPRFGMILYADREKKEHALTAHEGGMTREQLLEVLAEMGVRLD